jgi:hypothetical protein
MATHFQLDDLIYSADLQGGSLKLYIYENGKHSGGLYFRKTPLYPDEEITAEAARKIVDLGILDGKEIRVCNASDFLVFHFKDGILIHPETVAAFWGKVFA